MKCRNRARLFALPVLLVALSAQAHDPGEHKKEAEQPDCAAMQDMDQSRMDMKDPIMQAMIKKCMKVTHQDGKDVKEGHAANGERHEEGAAGKRAKHKHED